MEPPRVQVGNWPKLTARGGAAACTSGQRSVGGAGGGGFIGVAWEEQPEGLPLVTLDVSGGGLTETCGNVLAQDLHGQVSGSKGLAVALTQCAGGACEVASV